MKNNKRELPTLLAYTKGIEATEGIILNNLSSEIVTNTGVQSFKNEDLKTDQSNIITSEKVYLKDSENKIKTKYNLIFTGIDFTPTKCNISSLINVFKSLSETIVSFEEIRSIYAKGMLFQILTGIFAERNRRMSSDISVKILATYLENGEKKKEDFDFELNCRELPVHFYEKDFSEKYSFRGKDLEKFEKLAELISNYFIKDKDSSDYLNLEVSHIFTLVNGSIIYPSELFLEGSPFEVIKRRGYMFDMKGNKANKIKLFYKALSDYEYFAFTPEKVLNSLRRFDVWYNEEFIGPIPFEPQGNVSKYNKNFRTSSYDIFAFLSKAINLEKINEESLIENFEKDELLFLFSMFIRGGLFNKESEKKKG